MSLEDVKSKRKKVGMRGAIGNEREEEDKSE